MTPDILIGIGIGALATGVLGALAIVYLGERADHAAAFDARTMDALDDIGMCDGPRDSVVHDFTERAR
jgi:hypothetical protein